jgi:PhnB protein
MNQHALAEKLDLALEALLAGRDAQRDAELAALLNVAGALPDLPSPDFKARLWGELERRIAIAAAPAKAPAGFKTIVPILRIPAFDPLVRFIEQAFGGSREYFTETPGGGFHGWVRIGDSALMAGGPIDPAVPLTFHVHIDGVDDVYKRALQAGAVSMMEPQNTPYGEYFAAVTDPLGNAWYIGERATSEIRHPDMGTVTPYLHVDGAAKFIEFMKQAFAAELIERHDQPGRGVAHAKMRLGDSVFELSDPSPMVSSNKSAFYLYVNNVDAVYQQALAAGCTTVYPPAVQHYGDYSAGVQDPFGNLWFPSQHRPPAEG